METPWAKSTDECLRYFDVDKDVGLSEAQVERNLKKYGPNELPAEEGKSLMQMIIEQFEGSVDSNVELYFRLLGHFRTNIEHSNQHIKKWRGDILAHFQFYFFAQFNNHFGKIYLYESFSWPPVSHSFWLSLKITKKRESPLSSNHLLFFLF